MWCWRRDEKISWIDGAKNGQVLHIVKEERNLLHTMKQSKSNVIGQLLLKHGVEGKMNGTCKRKQ